MPLFSTRVLAVVLLACALLACALAGPDVRAQDVPSPFAPPAPDATSDPDVDPFEVTEQDTFMGVTYLFLGGNFVAISGLAAYGTVAVWRGESKTLRPLAFPLGMLSLVSGYYAVRFIDTGIEFLRGPEPSSSAAVNVGPSLRPVPGRLLPAPGIHLRLRF